LNWRPKIEKEGLYLAGGPCYRECKTWLKCAMCNPKMFKKLAKFNPVRTLDMFVLICSMV
jgi:hypothetical protein